MIQVHILKEKLNRWSLSLAVFCEFWLLDPEMLSKFRWDHNGLLLAATNYALKCMTHSCAELGALILTYYGYIH